MSPNVTGLPPRLVLVTRRTELDALLADHATLGQVEFFLDRRGEAFEPVEHRHKLQVETVRRARQAIPADWSVTELDRAQLDRFNFSERDIVLAIGQDGLVANIAKYLDGQPVLGVPTDPSRSAGVLTRTDANRLTTLLPAVAQRDVQIEARTMAKAVLDNGPSLLALNEIFIGHRSHQSARYVLRQGLQEERQSSSGLIISTGTGLTGWASSIISATGSHVDLNPVETRLHYFSREPWPSDFTGIDMRDGRVDGRNPLHVRSRLNSGGVVFADGIESDFLPFDWGQSVEIAPAGRTLNLVAEI